MNTPLPTVMSSPLQTTTVAQPGVYKLPSGPSGVGESGETLVLQRGLRHFL